MDEKQLQALANELAKNLKTMYRLRLHGHYNPTQYGHR